MNIPIELFIFGIGIAIFLAVLGFMARNSKAGMFTIIAGMVMFSMVALTENQIMGYEQRIDNISIDTTEGSEQQNYQYAVTEPILEPFTAESKVIYGMISAILMILGGIIMRSEQ